MKRGKILVTGAGGLVGSESVGYFARRKYEVAGIDNNFRKVFFGESASVANMLSYLEDTYSNFRLFRSSIVNQEDVFRIIDVFRPDVIIHAAAQPSHDFAAQDPGLDFDINAGGTFNLLEAARIYVPECVFIYTSTNKVYGDTPNHMGFEEHETRYEPYKENPYYNGIDDLMSIDHSTHSLFGVSKLSADLMVQEYGRYFGMNTVCFRCGCITGAGHQGAELHGFLAYLAKCVKNHIPYTVYGYKGKQVRDNIHAYDLVRAFEDFMLDPKQGAVYNIGGGRQNSCSVLEAIDGCEIMTGYDLKYKIVDENRIGDHKWWISSNRKFCNDYPMWKQEYTLVKILQEILDEV